MMRIIIVMIMVNMITVQEMIIMIEIKTVIFFDTWNLVLYLLRRRDLILDLAL